MRSVTACVASMSVLLFGAGCSEKPAPPPPPVAVKGAMELLVEKGRRDLKDVETWFPIADLYERAQQYPRSSTRWRK